MRVLKAGRQKVEVDGFLPDNRGVKVAFIREIGLGVVIKSTTNSKYITTNMKYFYKI
jgi:hypothetical protein